MRNDTVITFGGQFNGPGRKQVTHMPHPFNVGTLCGRKGENMSTWEGGYYETLPEITCKACQRAMPMAAYNTLTIPYKYARPGKAGPQVHTQTCELDRFAEGFADHNLPATWYPSQDGDGHGLRVEWHEANQMWIVLSHTEGA